jgi:hypothetical protein
MRTVVVVTILLGPFMLLVMPSIALADNCGSLSDCYGTFGAAAKVAAAIGIAIGIMAILPVILEAVGVGIAEEMGAYVTVTEGELLSQVATGEAAEGAVLAGEAAGEATEIVKSAETAAAAAESNFASEERLLEHFNDHAAEFGYKTPEAYREGARSLTKGGPGIDTFVRPNGDTLFYNRSTNEFGVLTRDGVIRTYFRPVEGLEYWLGQIGHRLRILKHFH